MGFLSNLSDFVAQIPDDPATALQGLDLAEAEIDKVISVIHAQQAKLNPVNFKNRGYISGVSFGGGDRAPALAMHHERAHAVTADTLEGVLKDLITFQEACTRAKNAIIEADETAAADLKAKEVAATSLTVGSMTNEGENAHQQAQNEHGPGSASDEPEPPAGTDPAPTDNGTEQP